MGDQGLPASGGIRVQGPGSRGQISDVRKLKDIET